MIQTLLLACALCGTSTMNPNFDCVIVLNERGECLDIWDGEKWVGCGQMQAIGCYELEDDMGMICNASFIRKVAQP